MAIEEVTNVSVSLIEEIGRIGLWLKTLGIVIVAWIGFQITNLIVNRKRRKALYRIEDRLVLLEKKIDQLSKKK